MEMIDVFDKIIGFVEKETYVKQAETEKKEILRFDETPAETVDKTRIAFIDGGSCEILNGGNFLVGMIRVYGCVFCGKKKASDKREESFVLVKDVGKEYEAEFLDSGRKFRVGNNDRSMSIAGKRAEINKVLDMLRRFTELEFSIKTEADIIVIDGVLETTYPGEEELLEKVFGLGKTVCAAAKSSNVMDDGKNIRGFYDSIIKGTGYCCVDKKEKYDVYAARLDEKGEVFRIDIHGGEPGKVLSMISANSKDIVFPGYPYGLLLADRFARVQNYEKEHYLNIIKTKLGLRWEKVKGFVNDAHEILDNIS